MIDVTGILTIIFWLSTVLFGWAIFLGRIPADKGINVLWFVIPACFFAFCRFAVWIMQRDTSKKTTP